MRHLWADRGVVWSGRRSDLAWDMGAGKAPDLPRGAVILHLAGTTGGDLSQNLRAARALAKALRPGHRLVLVSSIAVYGNAAQVFTETSPPAPVSDYARAKLEVEELLTPFAPTILRLGNLFGADALTRAALAGPVVLDQAGPLGPVRSWIGPLTFARVLWEIVENPQPGVFNLAQPPALPMGALLTAMGADWSLGPRPAPTPRAEMEIARLDLPRATPEGLVAELTSLKGIWP
ncbi:NAD-dependent epimerase/dehydratase family protein [Stagnihabitans tardus]|uniref:NAD-dependent epimerase/dehydratase family protein n=1 Tax=Stagnihabitans tardus TaxID=2699202 RepID=A0AAE4YBY0_9RHOB|nr:NAD-dependent epimerase/dehydratase family protein [Stagnihabitans tardus]